ncbi:MAG: diguanylate cyclase domain-containing protein [Cyanophyceae cyanobacterium]
MELFNLDTFSVKSSSRATPSSTPPPKGEEETYTVLAVDDTPSNLHLIKRILRRQSRLSLVTANSGNAALEEVQKQSIDLILMDMMMPGMDGVETCKEIRKLEAYEHIPIIFMTALDDTSSKVQGLAVAMDYLVKPFDADEFLARIYLHLRLLSLTRQLQVRNQQLQQEIKERELAETQLQRRNRRLVLLNDIVDDIRSTLDPKEILAVAATKIGQALEADYCCIYTLQEDGDGLELEAEYLEASLLGEQIGDGDFLGGGGDGVIDSGDGDKDRAAASEGDVGDDDGGDNGEEAARSPSDFEDASETGIQLAAQEPDTRDVGETAEMSLALGIGNQLPCNTLWMQDRLNQDSVLAITNRPLLEGSSVDGRDTVPIPLPLKALLACRASYRDRPNGLVLAGHYRTPRVWNKDDQELLGNVAAHLGVALNQAYLLKQERHNSEQLKQRNVDLSQKEAKLRSLNAQLKQWATRDSLTLLSNRRAFDDELAKLWGMSQTPDPQIGLLMCDVDYFKKYNDNYGHPAGDACLRRVAGVLQRSLLRGNDFVARYGGEEFVVVLPGTDREGAIAVAHRILELLAEEQIPHDYSKLGSFLTLSIGIACMVPGEDNEPQTLLDAADQALYNAKSQGRNRFCASGEVS